MTKRILPAALAIALIASLPVDAAFAGKGGGGGGGGGHSSGGGANRGPSDHGGGFGFDRPQTGADQRLFDQARKECNGPKYPSGATPQINYDANTFTCFEPGSSRR